METLDELHFNPKTMEIIRFPEVRKYKEHFIDRNYITLWEHIFGVKRVPMTIDEFDTWNSHSSTIRYARDLMEMDADDEHWKEREKKLNSMESIVSKINKRFEANRARIIPDDVLIVKKLVQ